MLFRSPFLFTDLINSEVQQLIKSVNRKGYDKYRCKDAPINLVCQSGLCRTKRFGVGFGEEEMPVLGSLTKYSSNPPQWFLQFRLPNYPDVIVYNKLLH